MNEHVFIVGSGESGIGAAVLAHTQGLKPFVSDYGSIDDRYKEVLQRYDIPFEEKGHSIDKLSNVGLVIKSPGVGENTAIMTHIRSLGVEVISEIEFAYQYYKGTVIAVTGSNGKTTTSGLLYHLMQSAGYDVMLGGNYGDSFAGIVADRCPAYMVVEVSSFQLDDISSFKPHIAILLNITPDHLDRYEYQMSNYVRSKFRINAFQSHDDYFIINGEDTEMQAYMQDHTLRGNVIQITKSQFQDGIPSKDGSIFKLTIKGQHNLFNASCAVETCRLLGMSEDAIAKGLSTFKNLPHRLESFVTIDGVEYINDSKATNVDSVFYALGAMDKPIVWIAGGTDKGNDYSPLHELVQHKVKALVCMGVDNTKLIAAYGDGKFSIANTHTLADAVKAAMQYAVPGDAVLLSPACASFDLFKNYIDRGEKFKAEVMSYLKC